MDNPDSFFLFLGYVLALIAGALIATAVWMRRVVQYLHRIEQLEENLRLARNPNANWTHWTVAIPSVNQKMSPK